MSKEEKKKNPIERFKTTELLNVDAGQSTLPIDTATEWNKGYALVNELIYELNKDTHVEKYVDEVGEKRRKTHIHPQLLSFVQERRRLQDQIWKVIGGEAVVEGQKQVMKNIADAIFNIGKDAKTRDENQDKIKKIIEAELDD